jgi:hypothetical protein
MATQLGYKAADKAVPVCVRPLPVQECFTLAAALGGLTITVRRFQFLHWAGLEVGVMAVVEVDSQQHLELLTQVAEVVEQVVLLVDLTPQEKEDQE